MNTRSSRAVTVFALFSLPATLLHEATHAAFSAPWSRELALVMNPRGVEAAVHVDWQEDAPRLAVALAHLAPAIVGSALAILVAVYWLATPGIGLPATVAGWGRLSIACWCWWIYVTPSREDVQGAFDEFR